MVYAKTRNEKEWKKHITALICVFIASIIMSINIKISIYNYTRTMRKGRVISREGEQSAGGALGMIAARFP